MRVLAPSPCHSDRNPAALAQTPLARVAGPGRLEHGTALTSASPGQQKTRDGFEPDLRRLRLASGGGARFQLGVQPRREPQVLQVLGPQRPLQPPELVRRRRSRLCRRRRQLRERELSVGAGTVLISQKLQPQSLSLGVGANRATSKGCATTNGCGDTRECGDA